MISAPGWRRRAGAVSVNRHVNASAGCRGALESCERARGRLNRGLDGCSGGWLGYDQPHAPRPVSDERHRRRHRRQRRSASARACGAAQRGRRRAGPVSRARAHRLPARGPAAEGALPRGRRARAAGARAPRRAGSSPSSASPSAPRTSTTPPQCSPTGPCTRSTARCTCPTTACSTSSATSRPARAVR